MNKSLIETLLKYAQAATDEKHNFSLVQQPNDLSYETFNMFFQNGQKMSMISCISCKISQNILCTFCKIQSDNEQTDFGVETENIENENDLEELESQYIDRKFPAIWNATWRN